MEVEGELAVDRNGVKAGMKEESNRGGNCRRWCLYFRPWNERSNGSDGFLDGAAWYLETRRWWMRPSNKSSD